MISDEMLDELRVLANPASPFQWNPPASLVLELIAEVKRLRVALAPFAEFGKRFTVGWPDETTISGLLANNLTLGDCRRAAL